MLPTRGEFAHFSSRGEYKGYLDYIDQELERLKTNGKIDDGEYAYLVQYYKEK
jgi:hypothetical protein